MSARWRPGCADRSVDIALVTSVRFELLKIFRCAVFRPPASGSHDFVQRIVHMSGHPAGITADIKMGAALKPTPQVAGTFQHPVLNINFGILVARECGIEPGK